MQSAQLKEIRAFDPERQGRWSFSSQQATLRRLDKAFAAFFRRVKAGETPGYPRFRGVNWFDTVDFPKDGDGCRWDSTPHDPVTRVRLQGVGHVKVNQHRPVAGKVKTVSVKREGKRWYVVLTAEQDPPEPLPATGTVVGIDMGIAPLPRPTSDGEHVANPRHGRKAAAKLASRTAGPVRVPAVQATSRTSEPPAGRGEGRQAARARCAVSAWTTHTRPLLAWSATHDFIAHEDLKIRNMVKAPAPKPDPEQPGSFLPNGAAAKAGLNQSIIDAGWGVFLTILHAKAESAGREVIAVDPRNTSRTVPRMRAHRQGEPAHTGEVPLHRVRPHTRTRTRWAP